MATVRVGRWAGGRVSRDRSGRQTYIIERMVKGERFSIALDVTGERAALVELGTFEKDPVGYRRQREETKASADACLDIPTINLFLDHLKAEKRSHSYRLDTYNYLGHWLVFFDGRPVRSVTAAQIANEIDEKGTARRQRLIALKSFCAFLRKNRFTLRAAEDPTIDVAVPVAVAAKSVKAKGYSIKHCELVYRWIKTQRARDVFALRCLTGMHQSEVTRVALGEAILQDVETKTEIVGTLAFPHKHGEVHVMSLNAQATAAARRLQDYRAKNRKGEDAHTPLDHWWMLDELREACLEAAKHNAGKPVPLIKPGEIRHSHVTWALNVGSEVWPAKKGGVNAARVAERVGHKSSRTTTKFYDGTEVPMMIAIPIRLHHPNDPPIVPA